MTNVSRDALLSQAEREALEVGKASEIARRDGFMVVLGNGEVIRVPLVEDQEKIIKVVRP